MTLPKPANLTLQRVMCGRSLTVKQSTEKLCHKRATTTLSMLATLLLIALSPATFALSQSPVPTAQPANTQAAPVVEAPSRRTKRWGQTAPQDDPKPAETIPVATPSLVAASPEPTAATPPQQADQPLPFMADTARESPEQPPSAGGLLVRTLGALLLIVGLIVAAAWGMKRFGGARFGTPQQDAPALAVLNSLSLGDRRSLTVVRFGDRTLLLGSTAHAVTLLAEAEADDFPPQARSVADFLNEGAPTTFSQELISASSELDEQPETRRGHHFTA